MKEAYPFGWASFFTLFVQFSIIYRAAIKHIKSYGIDTINARKGVNYVEKVQC